MHDAALAGFVGLLFACEPRLPAILLKGWGKEVNASFLKGGRVRRYGLPVCGVCLDELAGWLVTPGQLPNSAAVPNARAGGNPCTLIKPLISSRHRKIMAPGLVEAADYAKRDVICALLYHPEASAACGEGASGVLKALEGGLRVCGTASWSG